MSSFDFFADLPSVAREKIFRKCGVNDQRQIFRRYRRTLEIHVLDEIKKFKQPISCWLCQTVIWLDKFWAVMVGYNSDGEGGFEYSALRREPAHDTDAFHFLYKWQEKNHLRDIGIYKLRNFATDDADDADEIFDEFLLEIDNVFKARSPEELLDHIHFAHNEDAHIDSRIFDVFTKYQGQ